MTHCLPAPLPEWSNASLLPQMLELVRFFVFRSVFLLYIGFRHLSASRMVGADGAKQRSFRRGKTVIPRDKVLRVMQDF